MKEDILKMARQARVPMEYSFVDGATHWDLPSWVKRFAALVRADELRRIEKLERINAQLLEALEEAADDIEAWGAYASGYFQTKHDLLGAVNKARAAIAAAKGQA
jgi:hypothetical protein